MTEACSTAINWATVANNAGSNIKDLAITIGEQIKQITPEVWEVLIRQAVIDAIEIPLVGLSILVTSLIWWKITKDKENWWNDKGMYKFCTTGFPFFMGLIGSGMFLIGSICTVKVFLNPKYYAFMKLIETIK